MDDHRALPSSTRGHPSHCGRSPSRTARRFYGELFGWGFDRSDSGDLEYWMATLDGRPFAGLMAKPNEMAGMSNNWATYFGVADIDATVAEVTAAGGKVLF